MPWPRASIEFLLEVQQMEKKNLGLEALRKLLNDSIRSRTRTNVVETRAFTERLEDAIARYHACSAGAFVKRERNKVVERRIAS